MSRTDRIVIFLLALFMGFFLWVARTHAQSSVTFNNPPPGQPGFPRVGIQNSPAPVLTGSGATGGSTTYVYSVVAYGHDINNSLTPTLMGATAQTSTGQAVLSGGSPIVLTTQANLGAVQYDFLKLVSGTWKSICLAVAAPSVSGAGAVCNDTGQSPSVYALPQTNATTDLISGTIAAQNFNIGAMATSAIASQGTGGSTIRDFDVNGVVDVVGHGIVCDGSTDNTSALQTAINNARQISGTGVGEVDIPGSCNTQSGHALYIASGITIPDNVTIKGLGGSCYVNDPCVEILCGATSGACVTSTSTHGAALVNVALKTAASGSSGLELNGTFHFNLSGSAISGFTVNGLWLTGSASSAIYNNITNNNISNNGLDLFLDGTANSTKAIGGNEFVNNEFTSSTGTYNIVGTSFSSSAGAGGYQNVYQNDFQDTDISLGNGSATVGVQSNGMLNTTFENVTGESLLTQFQLNAGTVDFDVRGTEGAILGTSTTGLFTATGDSTYSICMGYLAGVGGSKCFATMPRSEQYVEPVSFQDPTGQIGIGALTNLVTHSEDFTNAAWTSSGIASTGNTATSPAGVANGATAAVLTNGGAAFFQQTYSLGSSIAGTCWTGSVWLQTQSGTVRPQLIIYNSAGTQLAGGALSSGMVTTAWQRFYVTGCASGADAHTGVEFRPLYFSANAPTATVNIWGAQLTETNGPQPYIKTVGSTITTTQVGSINPSFATGLTPSISGGGALATGSNSFSGTITGSAASSNVLTPGRICPNATICNLFDVTTGGGVTQTAVSTTSCTYSATASDTVNYQASCR